MIKFILGAPKKLPILDDGSVAFGIAVHGRAQGRTLPGAHLEILGLTVWKLQRAQFIVKYTRLVSRHSFEGEHGFWETRLACIGGIERLDYMFYEVRH
jgi:hypothetical protein